MKMGKETTQDQQTDVELDDQKDTTQDDGGQATDAQVTDQPADTSTTEDEVVVSIGEEPPPQEEQAQAPEWVRELRKKNREDQRRIRELEEQLKTTKEAEIKPASLGKKPTLDDYDYDAERFEQELTAWHERKRQHDTAAAKAREAEETAQTAWKKKLETYGVAKTELKVKDFDDAEAALQDHMSVTQQGIVIQGAENPALLVYALGKNSKKAKELALITDPVKFAFAVAKLETQLKVTNRRAPPPPEKTVQGTGGTSGSVDSTLDRLRAEAEKTGDYTKVTAYKRQKRAA